jgi:hypothetical protein
LKYPYKNTWKILSLYHFLYREENGLLYGHDSNFRLDRHIIHALLPQNCPSLAGKPKLIFIQACQGSETDDGAMLAAKAVAKGTKYINNS